MMLFELPEPVLGQTHVGFFRVEVTPDSSVELYGRYGTLVDGEFVEESRMGGVTRRITGEEFDAFLAYVDGQRAGAPTEGTSNFRDADLGYWLTAYGYRDEENTWEAPAG